MSIEEIIRQIDSAVKRDDIRGIAGVSITPKFGFDLGRAFAALIRKRTAVWPVNIVVGHDARRSGPSIAMAVCSGISEEGARPILLGLTGTEVIGFLCAKYSDVIDGGIIITASHNPREYNGFKFFGRQGQPMDLAQRFEPPCPKAELQWLALSAKKSAVPLRMPWSSFAPDYARTILDRSGVKLRPARGRGKPIRVAVEAGNGVGGVLMREIARLCPEPDWLFSHDNPDGSFPIAVPNPMTSTYQKIVKQLAEETQPDVILCFDGDADRAAVFDEKGDMIAPSICTTLVGQTLRSRLGGNAKIAHNLPSSWCVADTLGERSSVLGEAGTVLTPVGYGKIKPIMFDMPDIVLGAEHSGHYMFREFWRSDSGMMCAVIMLELAIEARARGQTVSEVCRPFRDKYFPSGEHNFQLAPAESAKDFIARAVQSFGDKARCMYVVSDGRCVPVTDYPPEGVKMDVNDVRVEFDDLWFCMRSSGTEKEKGEILRLYVESVGKPDKMQRLLADVIQMVGSDRLIRE